jgi:hypothetical protein
MDILHIDVALNTSERVLIMILIKDDLSILVFHVVKIGSISAIVCVSFKVVCSVHPHCIQIKQEKRNSDLF